MHGTLRKYLVWAYNCFSLINYDEHKWSGCEIIGYNINGPGVKSLVVNNSCGARIETFILQPFNMFYPSICSTLINNYYACMYTQIAT